MEALNNRRLKLEYVIKSLPPPTVLVLQQYEGLLRRLRKIVCIEAEVALDLGCGSGDLILSLALRAKFVIGLDISKISLRIAKSFYKNLMNVDFVLGDAEFLPFRSEAFDKIFAFEVLEHLPHPINTIKEVWRLLRGQGTLVTYQQYYGDIYMLLWHRLKLRLGLTREKTCSLEREHINQYKPEGWLKILLSNGFALKALLYTHCFPLLPFYPLFVRLFPRLEPLFF